MWQIECGKETYGGHRQALTVVHKGEIAERKRVRGSELQIQSPLLNTVCKSKVANNSLASVILKRRAI